MGKIFQGIFGGSKSKQESKNLAFGGLQKDFGGLQGEATTGANALAALLRGDASGFDAFKKATGFDFAAEQGSRGVTGNAAARGLLRSGSTGKSLVEYGNNIQNQFASSYLDRLGQQADMGFKAGNLISGAGNYSKGTSSTKPGIAKFLGAALGASDERLKTDIKKVGDYGDVGLYRYKYISGQGPYIGVMAQEVKEHYPEALGPVIGGYMTVDYDKLRESVNGPA
jgi:Chaperone of endosialidase